jgi:hypothetical protein
LRTVICQFLSEEGWASHQDLFIATIELITTAVKWQASGCLSITCNRPLLARLLVGHRDKLRTRSRTITPSIDGLDSLSIELRAMLDYYL